MFQFGAKIGARVSLRQLMGFSVLLSWGTQQEKENPKLALFFYVYNSYPCVL